MTSVDSYIAMAARRRSSTILAPDLNDGSVEAAVFKDMFAENDCFGFPGGGGGGDPMLIIRCVGFLGGGPGGGGGGGIVSHSSCGAIMSHDY